MFSFRTTVLKLITERIKIFVYDRIVLLYINIVFCEKNILWGYMCISHYIPPSYDRLYQICIIVILLN